MENRLILELEFLSAGYNVLIHLLIMHSNITTPSCNTHNMLQAVVCTPGMTPCCMHSAVSHSAPSNVAYMHIMLPKPDKPQCQQHPNPPPRSHC